jgi:hypothetical protein
MYNIHMDSTSAISSASKTFSTSVFVIFIFFATVFVLWFLIKNGIDGLFKSKMVVGRWFTHEKGSSKDMPLPFTPSYMKWSEESHKNVELVGGKARWLGLEFLLLAAGTIFYIVFITLDKFGIHMF